MDPGANGHDGAGVTSLETVLDGADAETYVLDPTASVLVAVIETLRDAEDPPEVRMLASGTVLRGVLDDFVVASATAELVQADSLKLRVREDGRGNATAVTEDAVVSLVRFGSRATGIATDDQGFVAEARESAEKRWDGAEPHDLDTPPLSTVRETLDADLGDGTGEDFEVLLESLGTARGDREDLDEVAISLLAAAKNERLFYDLGEWGESVGLASKPTFSRVKNDLEDAGLIETRKVPVDVGRPRQRLTLSEDRLQTASSDQLASVAASTLD